jgi:transposase
MVNMSKSLVDVPIGDGVHVKTAGTKAEKYVYKYTSYFRNADGNPRNKAVAIGKLDAASGKMAPNAKYFEFYNTAPEFSDTEVYDFGFAYLARKCAEDCGLLDCLESAFGGKALEIIVTAAYIMREGNAMDGIDDWLERAYFKGFDKVLSSQSTSRLFSEISSTQTHNFFGEWVSRTVGAGNVCYDVTSISSYSQTMTTVERGYNRDGEDLAQFNLGMFCDEESKMPLYFNCYNGSLTDKTNLRYVLANAKDVGLNDVKFVLDGGFVNEDSFQNLRDCATAFTMGIPAYLDIAKQMIAEHPTGIDSYANKVADRELYCVEQPETLYGIDGRLLLFYDPMAHAQLCNEMTERINGLKAELSAFKRYPKAKLKRYSDYFIITKRSSDSGFDFAPNTENIDKLRFRKGFFLIFTTDSSATHDDIIYHYRAKDAAEKLFDQMKIDMQGGRIRTHNEHTTNGKTFVTFVALALRTYMLGKLRAFLTDNSTSVKKVFNQLDNITILVSSTSGRFTKALTKKQKAILDTFGATRAIAEFVLTCIR